ncbi:dipeptidase [uncultured Dialister sp.]|uniref:dipeptidase n=1 Tax=uncultured Dialister sp. TaxID=278064 RepID=UPI00265A7C63|nr:membrane dipeptidase [uncultured Dialister sp.]
MKYIDFHCDTITELHDHPEKGSLLKNSLYVDLEKLKKGGCFIQDFALWVDKKETPDVWKRYENLLGTFRREMEAWHRLICPIRCREDLREAEEEGKIGALLSVEGGEAAGGSVEKLERMYKDGVRLMTLTWNYPNEIGFPNGMEGGITKKGREMVEAMENLHMIVDTSHLNDEGTREILMTCHVAPMASHSDARAVTGHRRNLPDDLIRLFGEKGGLIGLNFANHFAGTEDVTTLDSIVRHARHIRDVGGIDVLALGSDFDGIEPKLELKDASEMGRLAEALKKGGFKEEEIEKIFWWNGERYLEDVLR